MNLTGKVKVEFDGSGKEVSEKAGVYACRHYSARYQQIDSVHFPGQEIIKTERVNQKI